MGGGQLHKHVPIYCAAAIMLPNSQRREHRLQKRAPIGLGKWASLLRGVELTNAWQSRSICKGETS